jgi:hypothetical protein
MKPQGRPLAVWLALLLAAPASCRGVEGPALEAPQYEYKAVVFGPEPEEATRLLNRLTEAGWEYVGPLAQPLVAFRRKLSPEAIAARGRGARKGSSARRCRASGSSSPSTGTALRRRTGTSSRRSSSERTAMLNLSWRAGKPHSGRSR